MGRSLIFSLLHINVSPTHFSQFIGAGFIVSECRVMWNEKLFVYLRWLCERPLHAAVIQYN